MQMVQKLTLDDVMAMLEKTPEQSVFDWKRDLSWDDDNKKSEIVKDIAAVANATTTSAGFIFYGLDAGQPQPIVGMASTYDDAAFQQLLQNKLDPRVDFLYYEFSHGPRTVGVVHIPPSLKRPHIVMRDFGKLRQGQILIRQGSSTRGMSRNELFEIFYGPSSPYWPVVLDQYGLATRSREATIALMRELRKDEDRAIRDMEDIAGLPPGSLGYGQM